MALTRSSDTRVVERRDGDTPPPSAGHEPGAAAAARSGGARMRAKKRRFEPSLKAPIVPRVAQRPGFVSYALLVARKDLAIELATREIVSTSGFFAVLVALIASLAFYGGPATTEHVAPGVIWI